MRYRFLLAVLLIFIFQTVSFAQYTRGGMRPANISKPAPAPVAQFKVEQLNGKWQEAVRADSRNNAQSFTDTLLISVKNNKGMTKDATAMSMAMKGEVTIDAPATLSIAGSVFTIQKLSDNILMLQDENYVRTLKKVAVFNYEIAGDSVKHPEYSKPVNAQMDNVKGKWDIYRRQAAPGFITPETDLVKSLTIAAGSGASGSGEIVIYNGDNLSTAYPCVITLMEGQIKLSSTKGTMIYNIYKADGNEFIFGDEKGVMNYGKK